MMEKKVFIEKVLPRLENGITPTLLTFQNGSLVTTAKEKVQYCTMLNKQTKSKEAFIAVDGNVYTGPVNVSESSQLTDMYICVRNKATNKVRILPIEHAKLKNFIYDEIQENELKSVKPIDSLAIRKKRITEFSSKKASRAMAKSEKMQISMDVVKEDLDVTVKETAITEVQKDERQTYVEIICPKFNKEADNINEIYDINDIIQLELLNHLDREAEAVLKFPTKDLPIKSSFLLACLEEVKQSSITKVEMLSKIKMVIFMDALFNLITTREKKWRSIELSGITKKVESYIRNQFSADGKIILQNLKDKALCYYIVLCMLIDATHTVDVAMLAKELGRRQPDIIQFAQVVNALPIKDKKSIVKLTLPRRVPALKNMGNKRNKK